jgi:tetratricopeptide (TPR) repeat protein
MAIQNNMGVPSRSFLPKAQVSPENWEQLTPRQRYEKAKELIAAQGILVYRAKHQNLPITSIKTTEFSATTLGIGSAVATYGIGKTVSDFFARLKPDPATIYRSAKEVSSSSNSNLLKIAALGTALVVGSGVFAKLSYDNFAHQLQQEINDVFQAIVNNMINRQELLARSNGIFQKTQTLYFRQFAIHHPVEAGQAFIICGIAHDSNGLFQIAQEKYQAALANDQLSPMVHYLIARSYRLGGQGAQAQQHLSNIDPNSSYTRLGQIESRALAPNEVDAVFDDEGVPFDFLCPITDEVMINPVFHLVGNHRHYFERDAIIQWIQQHPFNPLVQNEPLALENLEEDPQLLETIRIWKQTRLI